MIKCQLKRYYKSRFTLVLTGILILFTGLSFYLMHERRLEILQQYNEAALDTSADVLEQFVRSFEMGIFYFEYFVHPGIINDFVEIIWWIIIGLFGAYLSGQIFMDMQSNYGAFIISRMSYGKYFIKTIIAQCLYMTTYLLSFYGLVFLGAILIIGGGIAIPPLVNIQGSQTIANYLWFIWSPIFLGIVFTVTTVLFATVSCVFIRNKYLLQVLPFSYLIGMPFIVFVVWGINPTLGNFLSYFSMGHAFQGLGQKMRFGNIINEWILAYPVVISCVIILVSIVNIRKFSKEYII